MSVIMVRRVILATVMEMERGRKSAETVIIAKLMIEEIQEAISVYEGATAWNINCLRSGCQGGVTTWGNIHSHAPPPPFFSHELGVWQVHT